jgi:hypothetical protein
MFAATYSSGMTFFYYIAGGDLVKATLANGSWQKTVSIFDNSTTTNTSKGSSSGAKFGLGVGLGLGVPIFAALGALAYVLGRRRRSQAVVKLVEIPPVLAMPPPQPTPPTPGPPVPEKNPFEIYGREIVIHELGEDEKHELSSGKRSLDPRNEKNLMSWV